MPRTSWTCISSLLTHWHLPSPRCCRYPVSICQMQGHPCCTVYCIHTLSHEPTRLQYVLLCTATPHMRMNEVVVTNSCTPLYRLWRSITIIMSHAKTLHCISGVFFSFFFFWVILFGTWGCTQVPTHPLPYIVIAKRISLTDQF